MGINGRDLWIEWCDDTCILEKSPQYHILASMWLPAEKLMHMELSLPSRLLTSTTSTTTESTDLVSLGSSARPNNLTFTANANILDSSEQLMGSLNLAANPSSYSANLDVSCSMADFCNSVGLSFSDV